MFSNYTAIFDACVLHPAQLRDLLVTLAGTGLFRARWTDRIHDEWIESVLRRDPRRSREKLDRTRALMDRAVPGCLVNGYETIIDGLTLPDPKDRHVLAAAIRAEADTIVTMNLRHFPVEVLSTFGIEPLHPDDFVLYQLDLSPDRALTAIRQQRLRLRKPAKSAEEFLASLEPLLPRTVASLRAHTHRI